MEPRMRGCAFVPKRRTASVWNHGCASHRIRRRTEAQKRNCRKPERHGCDSPVLSESADADFRKSTEQRFFVNELKIKLSLDSTLLYAEAIRSAKPTGRVTIFDADLAQAFGAAVLMAETESQIAASET